jgi:hypothetical protein
MYLTVQIPAKEHPLDALYRDQAVRPAYQKQVFFSRFRDCFHLVTFYPGPFMIRIY